MSMDCSSSMVRIAIFYNTGPGKKILILAKKEYLLAATIAVLSKGEQKLIFAKT